MSRDLVGGAGMVSGLHACAACVPMAWGEPWELGSAAFWTHLAAERRRVNYRLASTFPGEVVACLLGGAGIPGDVSTGAFRAMSAEGLLEPGCLPTSDQIEGVLSRPFQVAGRAVPVRYRFWKQRAGRLSEALRWLEDCQGDPEVDPRQASTAGEMRRRLLVLKGMGLKTASWVVRNHLGSDEVAIIDIHIARAGVSAGVFCRSWRLPNDYERYETAFLGWARAGEVRASVLDAVIWRTLADLRSAADVVFGQPRTSITDASVSDPMWNGQYQLV